MGRASKYKTDVRPRLDEVRELAKAGATNKEIADAMGVAVSSFCEYEKKFPELLETLREARRRGVAEVRQALFKKAVGFEYEEQRKVMTKDGDETKTVLEIYTKQSLPDTTAAGMYLRNYDEDWCDHDATTNEFKRMELELKKMAIESENW